MKQLNLKSVMTVLVMLFSLNSSAYDVEIDGVYYNVNNTTKKAEVTYYRHPDYSGSISIPKSITYGGTKYDVTSIGSEAFRACIGLTSVTIPNSVTSIGNGAFAWCSGLTSVTIPNSVTSIGVSVFQNCTGLTSVTIPNSITSIGVLTFANCSGLTSINIPNSVTSIGSSAFYGCSGFTYLTIPNSVTSIGKNAFKNCSGLSSVVIPNSVTSIGDGAFVDCVSLNRITIPTGVTSIGDNAFEGCSGLVYMAIPDNVTSIGSSTFFGCSGLTSISIPNSVTSIGDYAFKGCSNLSSITISNSVTYIGEEAFSGCNGLQTVAIDCREVGTWFQGNESIKEVIFEDNVTFIGGNAFSGCSGLNSVTIPSGVTFIADDAFKDCNGITSIKTPIKNLDAWCTNPWKIPSSLSSCTRYLYQYGEELTELVIPDDVKNIGDDAFSGCSLTSITIPNSVTSIGASAFQGCTGLTSVTIPNSVTSVGNKAFSGCTSMTLLTIEDGEETLKFNTSSDSEPFSNCPIEKLYIGRNIDDRYSGKYGGAYYNSPFNQNKQLKSLIIGNNVTSIDENAFSGCTGLTSLTIGNGVTSIGNEAFSGCGGLTSVTIPNSVTSIGNISFADCSGLKTIIIEDGTEILMINTSYSYSYTTPFSSCPLEELYLGRNISFDSNYSPFKNMTKLASVTIGNTVTEIGSNAFSGCSGLVSILLPDNILSIGTNAFTPETKLFVNKGSKTLLTFWKNKDKNGKLLYIPYDQESNEEILAPSFEIAPTTQTTAKVKIENWCDGFTYLYNNEEITKKEFNYTKLKPETKQDLTLVVSKDDVHYDVNGSFTTQSLLPRIKEWTSTASSISATGAYTEDDAKVVGHSIQIAGNDIVEGNQVFVSGLNPGRNYTVKYNIVVDYGGETTATYTGTQSISTQRLQALMAQPKVVSEGNVIVSATTNLDENEENVGFEWRCTDWTDEFPSNTGTAYLYDGVIEGYIKNLNTDKLWKCRPYYLSDSGTYHYGDWMGVDPTNTSYFEPTVHTYSKVTIKGNTALVKGYALSGTDEVKVQGFKYWRTGKSGGRLNKVIAIPTDAMTVELNNKQQALSTTLSNLEYDSEYTCVAFVTTTDGNTFYGEEQKFTIGENPNKIAAGDANGDGTVNVFDVTAMVNYILGSPNDGFVFAAADVNGDGIVNVFDVTKVVNIILGVDDSEAKTRKAEGASGADKLYIEDFEMEPGEEKEVTILLDNPDAEYRDLQFDLYLPEGITVAQDEDEEFLVDTGSRCTKKHTIGFSYTDGHYVCMLYSTAKNPLTGNSGDILTITLKADDNVAPGVKTGSFRNVSLSKTDATGPTYDEFSFELKVKGEVDAIEDVDADSVPSIKKIFRNGEIIIIRDGKEYDTNGKPAQ